MPYSYFKLSSQSGYGAGNHAPAYFELLWQALNEHGVGDLSRRYLSLVARHLREAGTHRSTAEVIEGVRLAETLSALKDGLAPTLADLRDAAVTLLGHGEPVTVREALAHVDVGTAIGELPKGVSQTSIQADFDRELERLKLEKYRTTVQAGAGRWTCARTAASRARRRPSWTCTARRSSTGCACSASRSPSRSPTRQQSATWAEKWHLQWTPGERDRSWSRPCCWARRSSWRPRTSSRRSSKPARRIAEAADLVRDACQCGLMKSMDLARRRLQELAATSTRVHRHGPAAWQLSQVVRYGDVRRFDPQPLLPLLEELFVEARSPCFAAANCDNKAAEAHDRRPSTS